MELRQFAKDWDFMYTISIPRYAPIKQNGRRIMQLAKGMLEKSKQDGSEFYLDLSGYRNTHSLNKKYLFFVFFK